MVLRHPLTGRKALYGMNSSTCAVLPRGAEVSPERMEAYDRVSDLPVYSGLATPPRGKFRDPKICVPEEPFAPTNQVSDMSLTEYVN